MKDGLLQELFCENAMREEATRMWRKFLRSGGSSGRAVNSIAVALIAFFYLWFLAAIVRSQENWVMPIQSFELVLLTLVMPASIYGAISGERERATWEALILTRLTPAQIIAGKLFWRVLMVVGVMTVLAVPMVLSQMVGTRGAEHTSFGDLVRGQTMIFAWGVLLCAFGLWVSANSRRSVTSAALIYSTLFAALILLPMLLAIYGVLTPFQQMDDPVGLTAWLILEFNPFRILTDMSNPVETRSMGLERAGWYIAVQGFMQAVFYLLVAGGFVYATHSALRKLEEPRRR
ncbi:MAG TPA: ABC transporter permease [Chthonomonadales bacterium]|nr:ABC transporter permease [Chthonomonadales bacterium]